MEATHSTCMSFDPQIYRVTVHMWLLMHNWKCEGHLAATAAVSVLLAGYLRA